MPRPRRAGGPGRAIDPATAPAADGRGTSRDMMGAIAARRRHDPDLAIARPRRRRPSDPGRRRDSVSGPRRRGHAPPTPLDASAARRAPRGPALDRGRSGADHAHRPAGRGIAGPRGRVPTAPPAGTNACAAWSPARWTRTIPATATSSISTAPPATTGGRVEYRATVEIYRPVDMTRWNRALYHTVPNRGRGRRGRARPPRARVRARPRGLAGRHRADGHQHRGPSARCHPGRRLSHRRRGPRGDDLRRRRVPVPLSP